MKSPDEVLQSFKGAIEFRPHGEPGSLRRPQVAALHSIIGYQSSGLTDPEVVIMPTGTGKTETMLAWMVAARPTRLLVIVPSSALRDQIAGKFETLGVLQEMQIVAPTAHRPRVGRLEHRFTEAEEAVKFVEQCNVIVSTPHVLQACGPEVRDALLGACTHLVVDEAHHAPAATWTEVIRVFAGRNVLLFTATPFRSDGRSLPGKVIFRFPLREAQKEGYFSKIEFTAVLAVDDPDEELAIAATARLRADLSEGLDHVLLVRAKTKTRADEIHEIYDRLSSDLNPRVIYEDLGARKRAETMASLAEKRCRIIVCVDMLAEGFDMPSLKVAAFHDTRKSLSPMIQLIGRLARTSSPTPIGTASVFVSQDPSTVFSPLRHLLREDPDWDKILSDVTERATARATEISDFDASFAVTPSEVPVGLLEPKMSAVAFRTSAVEWNPQAIRDIFGSTILDDAVSVSVNNDVAWFVIETKEELRWGRIPGLHAASYDLVVMYFDQDRGLLFIHGSNTKRKYRDLAEIVLGAPPDPINGMTTFRVFSGLDRIIPTNVGLLDARDRDKRFSMHVGSDVETALNEAERSHKANTHIAAKAFENGDRVTIAAALSGRFWSMQSALNLLHWKDWCNRQGSRLVDDKVNLGSLFMDMIIPEELTIRPPHPVLGMEWPWELYLGNGTTVRTRYAGSSYLVTDVDFRIDDFSDSGPIKFSLVTPAWQVSYTADFGGTGLHYRAVSTEVEVENHRGEITNFSTWVNNHKPTLFLSGDRLITGDDRLLAPRIELPPFDRTKLETLPWNDVNIRVESQGVDRRQDSIQAYMVRHLKNAQAFDVLIDDDRAGEAADLVGLRIDRDTLLVTLVHCKYSSNDVPGGRLADLYEVCGQAIRGARWRDQGGLPLLSHLDRRAQSYYRRTGEQAYEIGDRKALFHIRERAPQLFVRFVTIIAQPGLSVKSSTDEQLRLLAGAESYVQAVTKGAFLVLCSS